ncbi:precorrin-2 dehydrogenase/sirohydrochlorin ferrochelatase family protein [Solibacillus isronensis]|uniref:precorrin-2 dehydrogenase/sirohydrochlorin ferrochelatase family protein n=1 Tax=Solibacillus isronensis TaxID=412383 RepID=UPI002559E29A|nr:NAD(P)-dependent oxidoreductase [Solibacillus isronensis]
MVNIRDKKVVVIGGGKIAAKRIESLLRFQPNITVVSPVLEERLHAFVESGVIKYIARFFQISDVQGALLVIAATNDAAVNQLVKENSHPYQLINIVDDPANSSFHFPAIYEKNEITIAVTTSGISPMLAKNLRDDFAAIVDGMDPEYLLFLKEVRHLVKEGQFTKEQKRILLKECLEECYHSNSIQRSIFMEKILDLYYHRQKNKR